MGSVPRELVVFHTLCFLSLSQMVVPRGSVNFISITFKIIFAEIYTLTIFLNTVFCPFTYLHYNKGSTYFEHLPNR
jgi:hypothetical protein